MPGANAFGARRVAFAGRNIEIEVVSAHAVDPPRYGRSWQGRAKGKPMVFWTGKLA